MQTASAGIKCCSVGGYCPLRISIYFNLALKGLAKLLKMFMLRPSAMSPPGKILEASAVTTENFPRCCFPCMTHKPAIHPG